MEGFHQIVDWDRLLKFQTKSGSLLNSPASTACALKYTKNTKCLNYLKLALKKFNNGAGNQLNGIKLCLASFVYWLFICVDHFSIFKGIFIATVINVALVCQH